MAATITRGTTFTLGQQEVSVAVFVPVLTSATVANVDRDNVNPLQATLVTQQTAALDNPYDSEMQEDEVTHALKVFRVSGLGGGGGNFNSALALGTSYSLSTVGDAVVPGDMLMPSTAGVDQFSQKYQKAAAGFSPIAVACDPVSPGNAGVCVRGGTVQVRSTGTINAGEGVKVSSTAGVVESAGAAGLGAGPGVFAVALSAASGGYVWINLRR